MIEIKMKRPNNWWGSQAYTGAHYETPIDFCIKETRAWFDVPLEREKNWTLRLSTTKIVDSYKCKTVASDEFRLGVDDRLHVQDPSTGKWHKRELYSETMEFLCKTFGRKTFYLGVKL